MQTSNFFILGLPRSRTAWLSSFFNCQDIFCGHDLFSRPELEFKHFWELSGYLYKGSVDTNPISAKPYLEDLTSPLIIIERAPQKVSESLIKLFGREHKDFIDKAVENFSEALEEVKLYADLIVDYNDIDERLIEIFKMCCPSAYLDPYKAQCWKTFKVECLDISFKEFKTGVELSWQLQQHT